MIAALEKFLQGKKKYLEFLNRFINEKNLEKVLEECKLSEEELKEFEQYIIEEDLLKAFTFVRAFLMLYHKCIKNHENLFTYTGGVYNIYR